MHHVSPYRLTQSRVRHNWVSRHISLVSRATLAAIVRSPHPGQQQHGRLSEMRVNFGQRRRMRPFCHVAFTEVRIVGFTNKIGAPTYRVKRNRSPRHRPRRDFKLGVSLCLSIHSIPTTSKTSNQSQSNHPRPRLHHHPPHPYFRHPQQHRRQCH